MVIKTIFSPAPITKARKQNLECCVAPITPGCHLEASQLRETYSYITKIHSSLSPYTDFHSSFLPAHSSISLAPHSSEPLSAVRDSDGSRGFKTLLVDTVSHMPFQLCCLSQGSVDLWLMTRTYLICNPTLPVPRGLPQNCGALSASQGQGLSKGREVLDPHGG